MMPPSAGRSHAGSARRHWPGSECSTHSSGLLVVMQEARKHGPECAILNMVGIVGLFEV